jgi:hypothetical protein
MSSYTAPGETDLTVFQITPEKIRNFHHEAELPEAKREKETERQRPVFRMR